MRRGSKPVTNVLVTASILMGAASGVEATKRLAKEIVPTFEEIHLRLDPDEKDYSGSVTIHLEARSAVDQFRFHAEGLELAKLTLKGPGGPVEVAFEAEDEETYRVTPDTSLAPGSYSLEAEFTNPFDTQASSLYRMEKDGKGYAFTQFEEDDARGAFPCWDEPEFKIPFQITLTVRTEHLAISNTPVESETVEGEWKTILFERTKPLPTYLLALAVGPLETVSLPDLGVPGRIVTVAGQSHLTRNAIQMTAPILKALEEYFGGRYPYKKLDFIAIPEYWPGAMEHPGAVTFADNILLLDPANISIGQKRTLSMVIAHELAHMWFGDLVTMAWWDDLWLNESFADWMGDKMADQVFPEFDRRVTAVQDAQNVMERDARPTADAIRRKVVHPSEAMQDVQLAYYKGKTVLGMFEGWIGRETFRQGVLDYLEANAWGNAEAADLWKALDKVSGKKLSIAMATFLEQPGFPFIDIEVIDDEKLLIRQRRFRTYGTESADLTWRVPVALKYRDESGTRVKVELLDSESLEVTLDTEGSLAWILPNAGADGYYGWRLPKKHLQSLLAHASSDLTPRERVGVIGNLGALLSSGDLSGGDYLEALGRLAGDSHPLVLRSLISSLDDVRLAFVPDKLQDPYGSYLSDTLLPVLDRIGWMSASDEGEIVGLLRSRLYSRLGEYGHDPRVLDRARSLAQAYLDDPSSVEPAVAGVALQLAAMDGDEELYETYRKRFESAEAPVDRARFLAGLGEFRNPKLRNRALRYVFEGPVRPNEIFTVVRGGGRSSADRDAMFQWMADNYDTIAERLPPPFLAFMPFFAGGCSADRLARAEEFFADSKHQVPGTERRLKRVAAQVHECAALRQREGEAVAAFLMGRN